MLQYIADKLDNWIAHESFSIVVGIISIAVFGLGLGGALDYPEIISIINIIYFIGLVGCISIMCFIFRYRDSPFPENFDEKYFRYHLIGSILGYFGFNAVLFVTYIILFISAVICYIGFHESLISNLYRILNSKLKK